MPRSILHREMAGFVRSGKAPQAVAALHTLRPTGPLVHLTDGCRGRESKAKQTGQPKKRPQTRPQKITQQQSFVYSSRVISAARCALRNAQNPAAAE